MYKLQTHEGLASYINTNPSSQQFRYTPPSNDIDPQQSKQIKKNQLRDTGVDPEVVSLRQRAAKLLAGASALKVKDPQVEQMRKEAAGLLSNATKMEKENDLLMQEA
jgi:hypothetical protein